MSSTESLNRKIDKGFETLKKLKSTKALLYENLSGMKVEVDVDGSPGIQSAIAELFPEIDDQHEDHGFITFDMYMRASRVIVAAGQARAESEIGKVERAAR